MTDSVRRFADRIADIENRLRAVETTSDVAWYSIEDGSLDAHDRDGNLRQRIGKQDDGSHTTTDHNAPPLPRPTAPSLFTFPGGFRVAWDGTYADGSDPRADFKRVEIHVDLTDGFIPSKATLDATIETPKGASVNFLTADIQPHYVTLVAVNTSGVDSPSSEQRDITPLPAGSGGIHTYYGATAPTDPSTGDLWVDADGNLMYRWDGSTWVSVRDAGINQAIQDAAAAQQDATDAIQQAQDATTLAESKITTFYQSSEPTASAVGDLWVDTDTDRLYRWGGASWAEVADDRIAEALADAQTAQNTADAKIVSYFQSTAPTGAAVGDLWFDTSNGNAQHWWDGDSWSSVPMGTGAIAGGAVTTEILADGAATNAKLADEAVDDRVLRSLIALTSRLVAGDPTGARVELNGNGLEAYDAEGNRSIFLDAVDGSAAFTGTITGGVIRTAETGPRIEINARESAQDMSFYSGIDPTNRAVIRQTTFVDGTGQPIGSGVVLTSASMPRPSNSAQNTHGEIDLSPGALNLLYKVESGNRIAAIGVSDTTDGAVLVKYADDGSLQYYVQANEQQAVLSNSDQSKRIAVAQNQVQVKYGANYLVIDPTNFAVQFGDYAFGLMDTGPWANGGDFGWHDITPIGPASLDGMFKWRELLTGQIEIQCKVNIGGGYGNGDAIGSIPAKATPVFEFISMSVWTNTGNQSRINITTGGNIQLWTEANPSNVTAARFCVTYSPGGGHV